MSDQTSNTYTSAFFIVPSYILNLPGMTLGYLRVYEAIFQFWNHNKSCFLSEKELCRRSGLKRTQVYAALAYFALHQEVKRVQKGSRRYIIRPEKIIETDCVQLTLESTPPNARSNISQPSGRADVDVRPSGRETSGVADHNIKKRNKEITTTTGQPPNPSSSSTSQTSLSNHEKTKLIEIYEKHPVETENITTLDKFLCASLHSLVNRFANITRQQRLHGILKLVRQGDFEEPMGWTKSKTETAEQIAKRQWEERQANRKKAGLI